MEIQSGDRIKPDTVRDIFGLRNGANLALIDFAAKREEAMRKYPAIKSISVIRHLPDRVSITVTERDPFARIGITGTKKDTGRVCDDEGVVFNCRRGAETLPVIREPSSADIKPGTRLDDRSRQALNVLLVAREAAFADLNILEIDTSKPDFLLITFANYSEARFCWTGMEKPTPESAVAMKDQLTRLSQAIGTNLSGEVKTWNATVQGIVTSSNIRPN